MSESGQTAKVRLFWRIVEPKKQIPEERKRISNAFIKSMMVPLFFETLLSMVVSLVDTLMVSYAGEAAVSGVSLDSMIFLIFMYVFNAMATGGAVVISQYIGNKDEKNATFATSQMAVVTLLLSVAFLVLMIFSKNAILNFLYPDVEEDVMTACRVYLGIVILAFPANAMYNVGTALFRSLGKTSVTMKVSIAMNIVNLVGNAIGIFVLHAGAAGVAWPTVISWYVAAIAMTFLAMNSKKNHVYLSIRKMFPLSGSMIGRIVKIAVPNSIENGLFQLSKVVLGSLVSTFGTSQIAANGIGQTFWSLAATMMGALGPLFVTVTGRCMGAGDPDAAEYYMRKMCRMGVLLSSLWNILILALMPLMLNFYNISAQTRSYIVIIVIIHNIFCGLVSTFSGPLSGGLRAAGDVRFTMFAAIFSTVICRVALSFLFGQLMGMGVIGIALAMVCDWCIRAAIQWPRFTSGKWKSKKVIDN